jgi:AraC family transcriptional regulator of arabinose operon
MIEDFKNFFPYIEEGSPLIVRMVGETYCNKSTEIVRTNSDLCSLEFIADGCGTLDINGQHLRPEKDDIFFLKLGSNHRYVADSKDPWHKFWIAFDGKLAESFIDCYLPEDTYLFKNCNVKNYFEEIFRISKEDIPYDLMVDKITVLLIEIFMYIHNRNLLDNKDLPHIIKSKLDDAVETNFNLDDLCKSINYSKNYIINIFKEKYGKTPYQYFLERKTETAKAYLAHSNLSVGEIAKKLQYTDQQYFSANFKKTTGYSPLAYRKLTRRNV